MVKLQEIFTPLTDDTINSLICGQMVYITGEIYTARDLAHGRIMDMLKNGEQPPFDFNGNIVFYAGPSPTPTGFPIGSIGPTTAGRMDLYAPELISRGLKAMIGKGLRSTDVREAIKAHNGIYFAAIGGIAALMSKCVTHVETVAFDDLGTEAVRRLKIEKMPVIVAIDNQGKCIYDGKLED
ncbi:MAG: FumA C-terminus/TtdB family hydratase beta subunit [Defluviitaleaceae bacterium]|nr:FumA C-terminus/TtdB family hydratase beta subunit [Defluviitaleaceae bacterium]